MPPDTTHPKVHAHPPTSPLLQAALKKHLPHSVPLVYRTKHANITADAHVLATFAPGEERGEVPGCWAVGYLDRSMRPETELWLFTPGQVSTHYTNSPPDSNSVTPQEQSFCPTCRTALLSLTTSISTLPVPPLHPSNAPALSLAREHALAYPETGPSARYPPSAGLYMRHLLHEKVVTLGAVQKDVVQVLADAGLLCEEFPGWDLPLNKFFFRIGNLPEVRALPEELCFGKLREEDLAIVQARTSIPRTTRTLLSLENVGVFEKATGRPVAWTFLGLDGSLTTLHTEEEWRGKGIAKAVAAKIMREGAEGLAVDEDGEAWGHADVYVDNLQSESVCRSLGGEVGASILWCRIDLGRAEKSVESREVTE